MRHIPRIAAMLAMTNMLDVPELYRPVKYFKRSFDEYHTKEAGDEAVRAAQIKRDRKALKRLNSLPAKQ